MDRPVATIWTIGHSSRALDRFLDLLRRQRIERVGDVRRYAGSRAHPHFNPGPLAEALGSAGIEYRPLPALGGRRRARPDSTNTIWRNAAFRGYADYMETEEFAAALEDLEGMAAERRTCIMCSEAVWWRCHRSMIADALKARGRCVLHIMDGGTAEHPYTAPARVLEGRVHYGPGDG